MKVLVTPFQLNGRPCPYLEPLREAGLEVELVNPFGRQLVEGEIIERIGDAFAMIAGSERYSRRVLAAASRLRIIARFGVGYDKIDVAAATTRRVLVSVAFGMNHEAVADYTMAMLTALGCRLLTHHRLTAEGHWGCTVHPGVRGRTIGLVGLGRVGLAVARRCRGFSMRVLGHDVRPETEESRSLGVARVSLDTLLRESDFVSLHVPLSASTRHLMNAETLARMKPSAQLINTARGAIVDEQALCRALRDGTIAGAALDVFEREPPSESPLLDLSNVVLAPHAAGLDELTEERVGRHCVSMILAVLRGEEPDRASLLNPEVAERS